VLDLIAALRASRVRISLAESLDAMSAIAAAGLARERMREALRASLIKDARDDPIFDEMFASFFGSRRGEPRRSREERRSAISGAGTGEGSGENQSAPTRKRDERSGPARLQTQSGRSNASTTSSPEPKPGASDKEGRGEPRRDARSSKTGESIEESGKAGEGTRGRVIEQIAFESYTVMEYEAARDALQILARRFRARIGRRISRARRGRVDFRRTIRAGIQHGGTPVELRFRARRPRHIDLVVLADISGSVRYAAELMLELMVGAREFFRRMRPFVFIDRLAAAGFEKNHLVMTPMLDLYARSDFGRVLRELQEKHPGLFNRATVLVIMGDARNNRRPSRADILREISRRCRAVIWINPEPQTRWNTGDSAIGNYRRALDLLLPAENLGQLETGLARII
jgi:uncharacterized protein with von Willebrand factor type A (vWA) domain